MKPRNHLRSSRSKKFVKIAPSKNSLQYQNDFGSNYLPFEKGIKNRIIRLFYYIFGSVYINRVGLGNLAKQKLMIPSKLINVNDYENMSRQELESAFTTPSDSQVYENFCQIKIFPQPCSKKYHNLFVWRLKLKINEF